MLEDIAKGGSLMVSPSYLNQHQPDIYFTPALKVPYNLSLTISSKLSSKLLAHNWWTSARRLVLSYLL